MNVRSLRPNANLENLKKQAKQLLRRAKKNEPKALARFRQYFDSETEVGLKRAQLVLAREYGFESWNKLVTAVERHRYTDVLSSPSAETQREFLTHFNAGNVLLAAEVLRTMDGFEPNENYEAHPLLRAFVDSNSGHCYKKAHLQIAEMLIHTKALAFRDAVVKDSVPDVIQMLRDDPELVHSEFTAGRGIAQAIHHFRSVEMAAVLLDNGANINARTTVHHVGDTPVGIQLRFGTLETTEYMLARGANPNGGLLKFMPAKSMPLLVPLLTKHGWNIDEGRGVRTLLHHDAAHGHTEKVRILLSHGADPNARDAREKTALHLVAAKGSETIMRVLIDAGAQVKVVDVDGMTPLDYAQHATRSEAVVSLLS